MKKNNKKKIGFEKYLTETLRSDSEGREMFLQLFYKQPLNTQIALLRKFSGISQMVLAGKVKSPQPLIARIEKTDSDPRISTVQRIACILGSRPVLIPEKRLGAVINAEILHEGEIFFSRIVNGKKHAVKGAI